MQRPSEDFEVDDMIAAIDNILTSSVSHTPGDSRPFAKLRGSSTLKDLSPAVQDSPTVPRQPLTIRKRRSLLRHVSEDDVQIASSNPDDFGTPLVTSFVS